MHDDDDEDVLLTILPMSEQMEAAKPITHYCFVNHFALKARP